MRAKFTSFDRSNTKNEITVDPDSFTGEENIYLIESSANNAIVVVNENSGNTIVDNRLFRINTKGE